MRVSYLPVLSLGLLAAASFAVPVKAAPQTALVFFTQWSALFDDDARATIQHVSELAKEGKGHKVTVTGYADTTGSASANELLSKLRAQVVTDQLMEDGVAPDSITKQAAGETAAPEDSKQESRRVTIVVE